MRFDKVLAQLMLCAAMAIPPQSLAATFCPVTDDGKIRIDQCKYSSNEQCKRETGTKGDCVADELAPSDKAPFCLIMGKFEVCDKYFDIDTCNDAAEKKAGACIPNPYYKKG